MAYLIAGLGNFGDQYRGTRHNVGFDILEALCDRLKVTFRYDSKLLCDIASYKNSTEAFYFIKPRTFMNLSGESVSRVKQFYKTSDLLVLHDELDIPLGSIRFKRGGSSGGHNGLKSIDKLCGNDYARLRFGIGRSEIIPVVDFVLGKFEDMGRRDELVGHCADGLEGFVENLDFTHMQNNFTLKG